MFEDTDWGMTLKIWEATTWIRTASLNIWKDTTPWIAIWVVQLIRTHGTSSNHCLRSKNFRKCTRGEGGFRFSRGFAKY